MKFNDDDIGSNLMYAITSGLYSRDVSAIREYFQNAYDPPASASEIHIDFDNNGLNCVIKDNGNGMDDGELKRALGVGIYTKKQDSEGIFGIGIWSGIAVCDKIVIITKKKGSTVKLRLEIEGKAIREDSINNVKLTDFLTQRTGDIQHINAGDEVNESFTIIRLENISDALRNIRDKKRAFNEEGVIEFASRNLPVPIDPNFAFAKNVKDEFDDKFMRKVTLFVGNKKIFRHTSLEDNVRQPVIEVFSATIPGNDGKLVDIPVVKAWASLNKEYVTLSKEDRGIDFRHNGFKIEDWSSVQAIKGGTFHERWVGEIHIERTDLLRPTASRDAFQEVPWRDALDEKISTWLSEMQRINSFVSVGISGVYREIKNLNSPDITKSKKLDTIKKAKEKNWNVNLKSLENKPEYKSLISELYEEQKQAKKEFETIADAIKTEDSNEQPTRPDMKKAIISIAHNPQVQDAIKTLMEEKYEDETQVDPFVKLKKQIEKKTNETFSTFTEAANVIGEKLTLYPYSKNSKEKDESLKKFFKDANMIFRNFFEHGSDKTNAWFKESDNRKELKYGLAALIAFISNIIDELVPISKKEQENKI